mmetsp:Transcript_35006/g.44647  ORF Transcript_35006/g.44647 Transcript_35006/m.44647 type:complete len:110 (+) Transcript_35006:486-815(+)
MKGRCHQSQKPMASAFQKAVRCSLQTTKSLLLPRARMNCNQNAKEMKTKKNANGPKKQIEDTKIKIKLGGSGMSNESMQLQDGDENPNKRKWEEEHRVIGENSTKNASS